MKKHIQFAAMFGAAALLTLLISARFESWHSATSETVVVALIALIPALREFNEYQATKEKNRA